MRCSKCGNELKINDMFCGKCGERAGIADNMSNTKKAFDLKLIIIPVLLITLLFTAFFGYRYYMSNIGNSIIGRWHNEAEDMTLKINGDNTLLLEDNSGFSGNLNWSREDENTYIVTGNLMNFQLSDENSGNEENDIELEGRLYYDSSDKTLSLDFNGDVLVFSK